MYNVYQLFKMNNEQLPFKIKRGSWGSFSVTVEKIDNVRFSGGSWYCDAYTKDEAYQDLGYGTVGDYKVIGNAGSYQWAFSEEGKFHDENLIPQPKKQHDRGLKVQKAGKEYTCYHCKKPISKGQEYERYSMKSAGFENMTINEVFCVGHRDKMREEHFDKPVDEIQFKELIVEWNRGIVI